MALIDREYAKYAVKYIPYCDWKAVGECLDACPTIDPESLRPKGEWNYIDTSPKYNEHIVECTECGAIFSVSSFDWGLNYNFCPNCGADMRQTEDTE